MSQNKKKDKKQETKAEPVLPTEPEAGVFNKTTDGTKSQVGSLRMRTRDYLDAVTKNIKIELDKQSEAAAHGKSGLVSLRIDECKALVKVLSAMEEAFFLGWCEDATAAKNLKLKEDIAKAQAKLNGLANGTIKALSPAEKKAAAEAMEARMAEKARLEAELEAIAASLDL
jgi:hypothetical protein